MADESATEKAKTILKMPVKWGIAVISILVVVGFIIFATFSLNFLEGIDSPVADLGKGITQTNINLPWLESASGVVLGSSSPLTVEQFILHLAVFFILFFAFGEILALFSIFSTSTAWVISFFLSMIAGVSRVIPLIAALMAGTAGLGAIGISIIILTAIFSAVTLHIGIGAGLRRWRLNRQVEIEGLKAEKGTAGVTAAIKGLKDIKDALAD